MAISESETSIDAESLEIRVARIEERERATAQQLVLQAAEYERRLAELNHAHAQAEQRQAHFVSMDKYDGFTKEINGWRASVDKALAILEGRSGGIGAARTSTAQSLMLAIMAVGVIVALAVAIWK